MLDPVGVGASAFRRKMAEELLGAVTFTAIRGNMSEIRTLSELAEKKVTGSSGGVDVCPVDVVTEETLTEAVTFVKAVSKRLGAVVAVTGAIDLVSDGQQCAVIRGGREEMSRVTGTGCQLSGLAAAFAVARNMEAPAGSTGGNTAGGAACAARGMEAVAAAVCVMNAAGEIAWEQRGLCGGNASYGPVSLMLCTGWTRKCWREGFVMKCDKRDLLLYAVTDRSWSEGTTLGAQVEEALRGGATFVQLREKADREALRAEALEIQAVCRRYGVPFVINDDVALAKEIDADGVHVGQDDMEAGDVRAILGADKIIGVSAHNVEEALRAERHGADYLGVGAAFTTSSKPEAGHIDAETIRAICETVKIPVIAIGGIKEENLLQLRGNGLCGVAVISAIFAQKDIEAATRRLHALAEEMAGDQE